MVPQVEAIYEGLPREELHFLTPPHCLPRLIPLSLPSHPSLFGFWHILSALQMKFLQISSKKRLYPTKRHEEETGDTVGR